MSLSFRECLPSFSFFPLTVGNKRGAAAPHPTLRLDHKGRVDVGEDGVLVVRDDRDLAVLVLVAEEGKVGAVLDPKVAFAYKFGAIWQPVTEFFLKGWGVGVGVEQWRGKGRGRGEERRGEERRGEERSEEEKTRENETRREEGRVE